MVFYQKKDCDKMEYRVGDKEDKVRLAKAYLINTLVSLSSLKKPSSYSNQVVGPIS